LRRAAVLAFLAAATLVVASSVHATTAHVLGRSVDGRRIDAVEVGNRKAPTVLVVGCIHGNESAGIAVTRRLERLTPSNLDLWVVPDLNPDGVAADTRGNAHGVDLNRNFPYRWRRLHGVYESGPRPLSEPEARVAYRLILQIRPTVTVWFHQHLDLVWASGGKASVERRFARLSGLPYHRLPALAGSAIDWQNHRLPGTTAFAAELPAGAAGPPAIRRYVRAVLALGRAPAISADAAPMRPRRHSRRGRGT
jgi:protein MpaA